MRICLACKFQCNGCALITCGKGGECAQEHSVVCESEQKSLRTINRAFQDEPLKFAEAKAFVETMAKHTRRVTERKARDAKKWQQAKDVLLLEELDTSAAAADDDVDRAEVRLAIADDDKKDDLERWRKGWRKAKEELLDARIKQADADLVRYIELTKQAERKLQSRRQFMIKWKTQTLATATSSSSAAASPATTATSPTGTSATATATSPTATAAATSTATRATATAT